MTDFTFHCHTNDFKVTDVAGLKKALEPAVNARLHENDDGTVSISGIEPDTGTWDTHVQESGTEDFEILDLPGLVAPFLGRGEVAIFFEVGHRDPVKATGYKVSGYAEAINAQGERRSLGLEKAIWELAREL